MAADIWTFSHLTQLPPTDADRGLIAEARRLADLMNGGSVTVLAVGEDSALETGLTQLGDYGADRVLFVLTPDAARFDGECFAGLLQEIIRSGAPRCLLLPHSSDAAELAARLGALLQWAVVTCGVDLTMDKSGSLRAVRPRANGWLFEELEVPAGAPAVITVLPATLGQAEALERPQAEVRVVRPDAPREAPKTRIIEILEADPGELAVEEADIVVAGGRGVGKGPAFEVVHELARLIGGSVGGTRPVIDWQTLPFERQIGQTGKTVTPRLIINCGISGANEYTAGIESARQVIAINIDPTARIFRFADLGVVGDLQVVLPALIERIKTISAQKKTAGRPQQGSHDGQ